MAYQIVHGRKRSQKAVHLLLHFVALVVGVLGTYVIFKFHNEIGHWDMFSLDSWPGIIHLCTSPQWLLGFFTYWFPDAEKSTKATLEPWHTFAGMVIFLMGICTAEIGLARIAYYLGRSREALIVNFIVLLTFLFAVWVSLSVVLPRVD